VEQQRLSRQLRLDLHQRPEQEHRQKQEQHRNHRDLPRHQARLRVGLQQHQERRLRLWAPPPRAPPPAPICMRPKSPLHTAAFQSGFIWHALSSFAMPLSITT